MKYQFLLNGEPSTAEVGLPQIVDEREIVLSETDKKQFVWELVGEYQGYIILEKKSPDGTVERFMLGIKEGPGGVTYIDYEGKTFLLEESAGKTVRKKEEDAKPRAPMPGKILKIMKQRGDLVKKGESILIMEAMKMEHTIRAGFDGEIEDIFCKVGDQVQAGMELLGLTKKDN